VLPSILATIAAAVGAALLVAIGRTAVVLANSVRDSSKAVASLVADVGEIQRGRAEDRERLAVLWAERWPHDNLYPSPRREPR
jgi:hypothetical protein